MAPVNPPRLVLLNVAHLHRSPRRQEGAAVRILGVFPNLASLQQHALEHHSTGLDVIAIPLQKWAAIMQHTQGTADQMEHLAMLSRAYKERERLHEEEFRSNVSAQRTGAVRRSGGTNGRAGETDGGTGGTDECFQEAPVVARTAELRGQQYAVISILPDVAEEQEELQQPGLLVWEAFDTEDQAREHIKNHLAMVARDVHLDTVAMYEWLPLTGLDLSQIKEEFRDSSLTDIIQARKDESRQVEQYRSLCEQRGQEPAVVDLPTEPANDDRISLPPPLEHQSEIPNLLESAAVCH